MATDGAAISGSVHGRRYDVDALRVFAFGLLILYHVGMFYVADWGWHVKSTYQAAWLQPLMMLTNQWRMPLIFLISGLAVSFIWGKYPTGQFAARRARRLLIPLLFGMAFITFFLYAFLIARDEGCWQELTRLRTVTLALAVVFFGIYMVSGDFLPDESAYWQNQLSGLK